MKRIVKWFNDCPASVFVMYVALFCSICQLVSLVCAIYVGTNRSVDEVSFVIAPPAAIICAPDDGGVYACKQQE